MNVCHFTVNFPYAISPSSVNHCLEAIDFHDGLGSWCEQVTVGGESGRDARVCDYDWVLKIREQCIKSNVPFHFKQTGAHFRKEGRSYNIPRNQQMAQAHRAGIDIKQ